VDFVTEYAQNLSVGGLFIQGDQNLHLRQQVNVELELPGYKSFQLTAEVVHILDPESADAIGRKPGTGFTIVKSPSGFDKALSSYLERLGRRKDFVVLAANQPCLKMIKDVGFQTSPVPPTSQLVEVIKRSKDQVIAVVVSKEIEHEYAAAAEAGGRPGLVYGIDFLEEIDGLIPRLDEALLIGGLGMRILVADDDTLFLKKMEDILVGVGHEIITAASGNEALEKSISERPDLIILDIILPGMLGTEVCEILRSDEDTASIPIIMVSSGVAEMEALNGNPEEFLADDFMKKPIDEMKLLKRVEDLAGIASKFSKRSLETDRT